MPKVNVSVEVESSVYDLLEALAKVVSDVKAAVKAGGGVPVEVTAIGAALLGDLAPKISEISQVSGDLADSKLDCVKAAMVALPDVVSAVLS